MLRPGEVVFGQVRRSAPWPAIVITREEAEREGLAAGSRTGGAQVGYARSARKPCKAAGKHGNAGACRRWDMEGAWG